MKWLDHLEIPTFTTEEALALLSGKAEASSGVATFADGWSFVDAGHKEAENFPHVPRTPQDDGLFAASFEAVAAQLARGMSIDLRGAHPRERYDESHPVYFPCMTLLLQDGRA